VLALLDEIQRQLPLEFLSGGADAPAADDKSGAAVDSGNPGAASKPSTRVVDEFLQRLHVAVQQKSNIIQVSFSSQNKTTAAAVPNTLIQLYLDRLVGEKEKTLAEESERLDNVVLPALRQKMQQSQLALVYYRKKSGLVSNQNPTVLATDLVETKAQLALAHAHTEEAATHLAQAQGGSTAGASPAAASESPTLQKLREDEVTTQAQLSALRGSLGPNHPKTVQLETQLREIRDGIRREGAGYVGRLKAQLAAAQSAESAVNRKVAEYTQQFAQINGGDTQLQNLTGTAEADKKVYEKYLARSNDNHSGAGEPPDASFVSRADVPVAPSSVRTRTLVLVGIVVGAGIGMILVAMLDGLRPGLRSKEQVEEALGVRCLGLLPKLSGLGRRHPQAAEVARGIEGSAFLQPQSRAYGHAIRSARLKLLSYSGADSEPYAGESRAQEAARMVVAPTSTGNRLHRAGSGVVLVTAALPNEGKTWVATGLANSLATDGFSVALVDFDLHRPSVHRMFDGPRGPGVTDYFAGDATLDEIIHTDEDSGVNYVPVGAAASKHAWRITSSCVGSLIDRLNERHAFVILDSAPVLAVSETIVLSQVVRKTILVVKWGSTSPTIARHALAQLLEAGGAETAVLLSMVDVKRAAKYGDALAGAYKQLGSYYSH
jgi:polysaccharide biosynthesis transport protein